MEQEYIKFLKNQNKTAGTITTYILNLECYQKWLEESTGKQLQKLYRENIQDYISYLRTVKKTKKGLPLKAETINAHISALIKYNEFLIYDGIQKDVVITKADIIKIQRAGINPCKVTQEEIREFRQDILESNCRSLNDFERIRNFCIVTVLQFTGIRISECINIMLTDVAIETGELIIRNGKGEKQRTVYLNEKCISAIKNYLKVRPAGKYLFVTRESKKHDKPMNRTTVNKIFKKYSDKISPHQQRHAWATHGLESGTYTINEIQMLAGHVSVGTTQLYLNPDIRKMKEKANQQ